MEDDSRELAPLSLDGGADLDGGAFHTVEERELFPTESINSEASVAHLIVTGDGISALRLGCGSVGLPCETSTVGMAGQGSGQGHCKS